MAKLPANKFIVIAGVNGAGKSHVAKGIVPEDIPYLNPDRIQRQHNWTDIETARQTIKWCNEALESAVSSLALETTLTGHRPLALMALAKKQEYLVELHFIGLESVNLHLERVAARVANGGHPIPDEDIKRRYQRAQHNLCQGLDIADRSYIYDNSGKDIRLVATGTPETLILDPQAPQWLKSIIKPKKTI